MEKSGLVSFPVAAETAPIVAPNTTNTTVKLRHRHQSSAGRSRLAPHVGFNNTGVRGRKGKQSSGIRGGAEEEQRAGEAAAKDNRPARKRE